MDAMKEQIHTLENTIHTIMETMVTPGAKLALERNAAEGAAIAEHLLKQSPGKRIAKK
jgi:hypothetical protein